MIKRIVREYFTFSRSERRGIMVLLILIVIVILGKSLLSYVYRPGRTDFSAYRKEIAQFEASLREQPDGIYSERYDAERSPYQVNRRESGDSGTNRIMEPSVPGRPGAGQMAGSTHYGSGNRLSEPVMVNLNRSDSLELMKIKGIGPVLSRRIVKYRYLIGGFMLREQLLEVYGINSDNYGLIAPQVFIDTAGTRYIDLNTTDLETLCRHPYLDAYQARAIISYRELQGRFTHAGQLVEENLLPEETYNRIRDYLRTY
jgi:DNA uptake protein ComE-like DNA-binding protein